MKRATSERTRAGTARPASGRTCTARPTSGSTCSARPASGRTCTARPTSGSTCSAWPASGGTCTARPTSGSAWPTSGRTCTARPTSGRYSAGYNRTVIREGEANLSLQKGKQQGCTRKGDTTGTASDKLQLTEQDAVSIEVPGGQVNAHPDDVPVGEKIMPELELLRRNYHRANEEIKGLRIALAESTMKGDMLHKENDVVVANVNTWIQEQKNVNEVLGNKIREQNKVIGQLRDEKEQLLEEINSYGNQKSSLGSEIDKRYKEAKTSDALKRSKTDKHEMEHVQENSSIMANVQGLHDRHKVTIDEQFSSKMPSTIAERLRNNLDFYQNKIHSNPPPGYKLKDMLKWKGDNVMLEENQYYIQWLFPIREESELNIYAQPLMDHEAQAIRKDETMQKSVLDAYTMMLDFFGMQLDNSIYGTVKRSNTVWKQRYEHLNTSRHNYVRITRILKSIGELGYERFQAPLVDFLIEEAVVTSELPHLAGPCMMYWITTVVDRDDRERLFRKTNCLINNQHNQARQMIPESKNKDIVQAAERGTDESPKAMSILQDANSDNKVIAKPKRTMKAVPLPSKNLLFYQNNFRSTPVPGYTIQTMLLKYKGDRKFLEEYPSCIQWLFPIPEGSTTNRETQALYEHEAKAIKDNDTLSSRVLDAYKMILECYGMRLLNPVSGKIGRIKCKYKHGYDHINTYTHNYVRITRVLVSLGELGYSRFQVPWIDFLVQESVDNSLLPTVNGSNILQWINAVKDDIERQGMLRKYQKLVLHGEDNVKNDSGR